jgi:dienelactone hydrolase
MFIRLPWCRVALLSCLLVSLVAAEDPRLSGDEMLAEYFRQQTARIADDCLTDVGSLDAWKAERPERLRQLRDMLGLEPEPERTPLQATITGTLEGDGYVVERLHFQSRPGLYVTANLYRPKVVEKPLPAILYQCGHAQRVVDGVSHGNKSAYQHHGIWFARHGYVCLTIDSLQLGEIQGIHHGTYRYDRWWWLNRGYTPAGVEAWNAIRALDYLETRPEVDAQRIGCTGRSGGGAYSWWIAALDERIQCAIPVAGITDLEDHVVDGVVKGHCDCMYFCNTYQWDYPMVAAMIAPRPLLLSNTDRDPIFPLRGVMRTHWKVRKIYELYGEPNNFAVAITAGGHNDTEELQVAAFRWFDQHLKDSDRLIDEAARPSFPTADLRVFDALPEDERNTKIDETFVAAAETPAVPQNEEEWKTLADSWRDQLLQQTFAAWPSDVPDLDLKLAWEEKQNGLSVKAYDFTSQEPWRLQMYVVTRADLEKPELAVVNILDKSGWQEFQATYRESLAKHSDDKNLPEVDQEAVASTTGMLQRFPWALVYVAPRGVGPSAWTANERDDIQIRRKFYLLGQTLHGMQIFDARRGVAATQKLFSDAKPRLWLQGEGEAAGLAVYAAIFEPSVERVDLHDLTASHHDGPFLLNISKTLDLPQALALTADTRQVVIYTNNPQLTDFGNRVAEQLNWDPKTWQVRKPIVAE